MLVVAIAAVIAVVAIRLWWSVRAERQQFVDDVLGDRRNDGQPSPVERLILRTRPGRALQVKLRVADLTIRVHTIVIAMALVDVVAWFVIDRLLGSVFALVAVAGAPLVGLSVLDALRARRLQAMIDQLPDLATGLASAAAAGLSVPAALRAAARDLAAPLGDEVRETLDLFVIGTRVEAVLDDLEERVPSREMSLFVTTLTLQIRIGGNLVTTLRQLASALEDRRDVRREVMAVTSSVRTTAYMIVGVSFAALALLNLARPGAIANTMSNQLGLVVMLTGTAMFAVGTLLVRRYSNVEV